VSPFAGRHSPAARPDVPSDSPEPLPAAADLAVDRRSVVLETAVRLVFHTVLVLGIYLLFAGHNQPGGGFIGGLVVGTAFTLRYVAGGRSELRAAVPVDPGIPLGAGLVLATATGLLPLLVGGQFLESDYVEYTLPVLGHVKLVLAVLFDLGVFLVVVGLVLGVLRTLGAEAEK
jgi:multicomponent Na+:H+ antiporter subunit A